VFGMNLSGRQVHVVEVEVFVVLAHRGYHVDLHVKVESCVDTVLHG
jgi:hypothetical protein